MKYRRGRFRSTIAGSLAVADLYQLLAKLGLDKNVRIVGHDIGTMVAYCYAAAHASDVVKLVLSEAPIPDQMG
jgi:pimeloyl-ACP methyl ester carboxylesterase